MKVSVIIPVYNSENYIEECIKSIINQSLDNIEIIFVNDGTKDKSMDIVEKYKHKSENIIIINQENRGPGGARNRGLEAATGEYIYFLDSDDYIEPNSMEICYNECKKNNLDILTFDAECFYDYSHSIVNIYEEYQRDRFKYLGIISGREFYIKSVTNNMYKAPVWLNFYSKEFISKNKLAFVEKMLHEDEIYTLKSLLIAKRVKYINKKLYNRRFRNDSIMTSNMNRNRIIGDKNVLMYLLDTHKKYNEINDIEIINSLDSEINRIFNRIILHCDQLGEYNLRNEIIKYIREKKYELNINSNIRIDLPMLSYNNKIMNRNKEFQFDYYKNKNSIYFMLIPECGDFGEQAIIYATIRFLEDNYPDYRIIQINYSETSLYIEKIKKCFKRGDFIVLNGGGNIGNHYILEEARRYIINNLNSFPIISFPQTIYFSNDKEGSSEFKQSRDIYNQNKDLILFAREEKSYEIMKKNFKNNNIYLIPDIVFYLCNKIKPVHNNVERNQIMTCFRKDKESYFEIDKKEEIIKTLSENFSIFENDTIMNNIVGNLQRNFELRKIWDEYYKSKLVITDTLHGMIFAVITKTPCIVLRSSDYKVTESYKWIKNLNYIKIADDLTIENFNKLINELTQLNENSYIDSDIDFENLYFKNMNEYINVNLQLV